LERENGRNILEARLDEWKVALEGFLVSDQIAALKEEQHQVGTGGGMTMVTMNGLVVNGGGHQVVSWIKRGKVSII